MYRNSEVSMYVVVNHQLTDPPTAFERGKKLMSGEGAPPDTRVLQFLPSREADMVTCIWQADSITSLQTYVDETLGDSSSNACFEIDAEQAFADDLPDLQQAPAPSR
jgi:hypothetical protein